MDLAINMKAVLVASYFTALSLQVNPFFPIPPSVSGGKNEEYSEQVDPGGDDESYEYVDEKEIDSRENEEKGVDDGDRLVGGKITNTRFVRRVKLGDSYSSQDISFRGWLEPVWLPRPNVLQW